MKVPVATRTPSDAALRVSIAGGGGNTYGNAKKPMPTPKAVPSTPPSRKKDTVRHMTPVSVVIDGEEDSFDYSILG